MSPKFFSRNKFQSAKSFCAFVPVVFSRPALGQRVLGPRHAAPGQPGASSGVTMSDSDVSDVAAAMQFVVTVHIAGLIHSFFSEQHRLPLTLHPRCDESMNSKRAGMRGR